MLVIHGIWAREALCLWAEDSALPASLEAPAAGRSSRAPRPHPFAADPGVLGDALGSLGEGPRDLASKAAADELSLWLPSAGPGPGCAPELIRPADLEGDGRGDKRGAAAGAGPRSAAGGFPRWCSAPPPRSPCWLPWIRWIARPPRPRTPT